MTKKSTASETKRKGSKSALKSGQGIEDQVMDILDKGVKVESRELAQANLKIIVEFAWDKLKNERLKKAPMVATTEKDADGNLLKDDKGKVLKVPSPTYIDGIVRAMVNTETQGRTTSHCLGFFQPNRFQDSETGDTLGLINFCPEFLNPDNPQFEENIVYEFAQVAIHETVHMMSAANGLQDCSKQRHNELFKRMVTYIGLDFSHSGDGKDKKIGWGRTKLSDELRAEVDKLNINAEALRFFATEMAPKKSGRSKQVKWACPSEGCGVSFRTSSSQHFNIACMNCTGIDDTEGFGTLDNVVLFEIVKVD